MHKISAIKKGIMLAVIFSILDLMFIYYSTYQQCQNNHDIVQNTLKSYQWDNFNDELGNKATEVLNLEKLVIIEDNATIYDFSIAGNSLSRTLFPLEKTIKVNGKKIEYSIESQNVFVNFVISAAISLILIILTAIITSTLGDRAFKAAFTRLKNDILHKRYTDIPFEDLSRELSKNEAETQKNMEEANKLIERLKADASIDSLTNLYNRYTFKQNFQTMIKKSATVKSAIGIIRASEIRQINTDRGYIVGDQYIVDVANMIGSAISRFQNATAYRISGSDFALLIYDAKPELIIKLNEELKLQIDQYKKSHDLDTVCFSGYTLFNSAEKIESIMARTDLALAKAQTGVTNGYVIELDEVQDYLSGELQWKKTIDYIINHHAITLYYQPIRISNLQLKPYTEIFAHFKSPEGEHLSTETVLAAALRHDKLPKLESIIIETIIAKYRQIKVKQPEQRFGINLSSIALTSESFLLFLERTLIKNEDIAPNLVFEIDEDLLECNTNAAERLFSMLKRCKALTSISHFGTGVKSFQLFQYLKANYIKLDPNICQLNERNMNSATQTFYNMINNSAHRVGCGIIAEGVETHTQARMLEKLLVDGIQGYAYQKPMILGDEVETAKKNNDKELWEILLNK